MAINQNTLKAITKVYREFFCLSETAIVLIEEHVSKDDVEPGYVDILVEPVQEDRYRAYYTGVNGWMLLCVIENDTPFYDERFVRKADTDAIGNWMRGDLQQILDTYDCIYVTDEEEMYDVVEEISINRKHINELGLHTHDEYIEAKYTCPCCGENLRNQSYHCCDSSNFI